MAYTAPTVVTDPAAPGQTNTALTAVNVFVSNLYTDAIAILQAAREHIRLHNGNSQTLETIDRLGAIFGSPGNTDATVSTDPVTQADGNAAMAVHVGYIDTFTARLRDAFSYLRGALKLTGGLTQLRADLDSKLSTFGTATVAVTCASDPVAAADMNTSLAAATARVDSLNVLFAEIAELLKVEFRVVNANPLLMAQIDSCVAKIRAH